MATLANRAALLFICHVASLLLCSSSLLAQGTDLVNHGSRGLDVGYEMPAEQKKTLFSALTKLRPGDSLDQVFCLLGSPSAMETKDVPHTGREGRGRTVTYNVRLRDTSFSTDQDQVVTLNVDKDDRLVDVDCHNIDGLELLVPRRIWRGEKSTRVEPVSKDAEKHGAAVTPRQTSPSEATEGRGTLYQMRPERKDRLLSALKTLKPGDSLDRVLCALGAPDRMSCVRMKASHSAIHGWWIDYYVQLDDAVTPTFGDENIALRFDKDGKLTEVVSHGIGPLKLQVMQRVRHGMVETRVEPEKHQADGGAATGDGNERKDHK